MQNRDNTPSGFRPDIDRARTHDTDGRSPERRSWDAGPRLGPVSNERHSQRGYGEASSRGGYGEGGYQTRDGSGGYGSRGYGSDDHRMGADRGAGRQGGAMPTYGDRDEQRLAQRSQWREDQRYGDHGATGETWRHDNQRRDPDYGGVDRQAQGGADHHFEPHYRSWRDQQLSSHDQDYARWRDQQAKRYDDEYRGWREQRHESFSRDFQEWRSRQSQGTAPSSSPANAQSGAASASASNPGLHDADPVQTVTDGHGQLHHDDTDDSASR